jgi:hypothetical protein
MATQFEVGVSFKGRRYQDAEQGLQALAKDLGKLEHNVYPVVSVELRRLLDGVTEALARRHGNPYPAGTTGNSLSRRSGDLVASLKAAAQVIGSDMSSLHATLGGVFYARIQEEGGTIVPKKAKYLTIPLPAALNANGTPKKQKARDWDKTFIIESKKGNLLIVRREGKALTPLYVLKTQVYIPPRLNLRASVDAAMPAWIDELGDKLLTAMLGD